MMERGPTTVRKKKKKRTSEMKAGGSVPVTIIYIPAVFFSPHYLSVCGDISGGGTELWSADWQ